VKGKLSDCLINLDLNPKSKVFLYEVLEKLILEKEFKP
jgi:hypothetical protein